MRPPLVYPGGKQLLATRIAAMLPPHRTYIEPFFGSGAVFFAKRPSPVEVVGDLDGDVVNFFRCVRDHPGEMERLLWWTPYARAERQACSQADGAVDDLERARRWWTLVTQNIASVPRGSSGWLVKADHSKPSRTRRNAETIPAIAYRLRDAYIECRPAEETLRLFDDGSGRAVAYVDPPYLGDTRSTSRHYKHEMKSAEEHERLAIALHGFSGGVILSGYDSDLYRDLFGGWRRIRVPERRQAVSNSRGVVTEGVLWMNPAAAEAADEQLSLL